MAIRPIDKNFDIQNGQLKEFSKKGRESIEKAGVTLIIHPHIHSKTICVDNKMLIEGSFNWLSATRLDNYAKNDSSILLEGDVSKYIDIAKKNLDLLKISEKN